MRKSSPFTRPSYYTCTHTRVHIICMYTFLYMYIYTLIQSDTYMHTYRHRRSDDLQPFVSHTASGEELVTIYGTILMYQKQYTYTCIHTCIHLYIPHACIKICKHTTYIHIYISDDMQPLVSHTASDEELITIDETILIYIHKYTCTYIHTCIHIYIPNADINVCTQNIYTYTYQTTCSLW